MRVVSAHYRGKIDDIKESLENMDKLKPQFDELL